jgi:hypothetical protein
MKQFLLYIDPGSGSYLVQVIIAAILGVVFYFVNTVSKFGDEQSIWRYVKEQGLDKEYKTLHKSMQLHLR